MDPCAPPAEGLAADSTLSPNKRKSTSPSPDERPAKHQKISPHDSSSHDLFAIPHVSMSFTSNQTTTSELLAAKPPGSGAGVSKYDDLTSEPTLKFSVLEYFAEQQLGLARAARRSSFAQERVAIKLLSEMELFRHSLDSEAASEHSLPYRAQRAFALARAAQETLEAEKEYADRRAEEARLVTKAEEERVQEVERRLIAATAQTNVLSLAMRNQHLGKDWVQDADNTFHFEPTVRHQERWPYPSALENESGSESDYSGLVSPEVVDD